MKTFKTLFLLFSVTVICPLFGQTPNYPYTTLIVPQVQIPGSCTGKVVAADGTGCVDNGGPGGPFLPLAGGTLTGALNGTDGNFSGTVAAGTTNPVSIGGATGSCTGKYANADGTGCSTATEITNGQPISPSSVSIGTTLPASNPSLINVAQPAEGTIVPILSDILATAGAAPFQVQQQSFPNSGGGAGTHNAGVFYGYNVGYANSGPTTTGQPGLVMGMESNFYDTAGSDYGPEWYVEHYHPNGVFNLRPFYARVLNGNSNTGSAATITHDIGSDSGVGQFLIQGGVGNQLVNIQTNGAQFNVPLTMNTQPIQMQGANAGVRSSGNAGTFLSYAVNQLYPQNSLIVNAWGNSSNPGISVGTIQASGIAFQVVSAVNLDGNGYPSTSGTPEFVVYADGHVTAVGVIHPGGYKSRDGSDGITETCSVSPTSMTIKNGIITAISGGVCTP